MADPVKMLFDLKGPKVADALKRRGFDAFYHLAWEGTLGANRADYNMQLKNVAYAIEAAKAAAALQCKKFIC